MEKQYDGLMDSKSDEQMFLLEQAQQAWEQYLQAEADFSARFYLDQEGTMWHIYIVNRQAGTYRERALALAEYRKNFISQP